ncbi:MAG: hypothetical protein ACRCUT_07370, partial [Spirochaetota bacterium]
MKIFTRRAVFIAVALFALSFPCEGSLLIFGEYGSYNKAYRDLEYKDAPRVTFSVPMSTVGAEYRAKGDGNVIVGASIVCTSISSGSVDNAGETVCQPACVYVVPGVFTGYDFGFWGWELGISCMYAGVKGNDRFYYDENGAEMLVSSGAMYWDRQLSHVFVNAMFRLFPEDFFHFKVRIGRERFNPVDTLVNAGAVLPYGNHEWEILFSCGTVKQYFYHSRYILKNNQKAVFRYGYEIRGILIG